MIPVVPQPEPASFDATVRTPGLAWLCKRRGTRMALASPLPHKGAPGYCKDFWQNGHHWREAIADLRREYASICAYSALWVPPGTGFATVDHFVPKSLRPDLAYEWTNFRFASGRANGAKGDHADVLDPFHDVGAGWFHLEFALLSIYPDPSQPDTIRARVQTTIDRLALDGADWRAERQRYWDRYLQDLADGKNARAAARDLARDAPHVHAEAQRQGLLR